MKSNGLNADEKCFQNNTELALVRVLADMHGTPITLSVSAAGPDLCKKLKDLLPNESFSTIEAKGVVLGMSGIVSGREECLMLTDIHRTLKEAERNG
jgi:hypothetical protein